MKGKFFFVLLIMLCLVDYGYAQLNSCQVNQSIRMVVLGSSTAEGAGASVSDSAWVNLYRTYLQSVNAENSVINLAKGGYSSYRLMPDAFVPPSNRPAPDTARNISKALSLDPDVIVVNLPSNDIAAGFGAAEMLANYDSLRIVAEQAGVPLWFSTTQPRNFTSDALRQIQFDLHQTILADYAPEVLDFWNGIADDDNRIDSLLNSGDDVHLNNAGHAILFNRVVEAGVLQASTPPFPGEDMAIVELIPSWESACGDQAGELGVVLTNLSAAAILPPTLYLDWEWSMASAIETDSLVFTNPLASCTQDTFWLNSPSDGAGIYTGLAWLAGMDDRPENDWLQADFSTIGFPSLQLIGDTLCAPGSPLLQGQLEIGDTLFWYSDPSDPLPIGFGPTLLPPVQQTSSTWYAEAVRGDLHFNGQIETSKLPGINWNGAMFDLVATEDLWIDSLGVNIHNTGWQGVEIFITAGSHLNVVDEPGAWDYLCVVDVLVSDSLGFTVVPITPFHIPSGDTIGVYVQMQNANSRLTYRNVFAVQERSTDQLSLITGSGISHDFGEQFYPRDWNGQVFYHYGSRPDGECKTDRLAVEVPLSQTIVDLGLDTIIDLDATLTLSGPPNMLTYQWFDGSESMDLVLPGSDLGFGIHYVDLTVQDSLLCLKEDTVIVGVADLVGTSTAIENSLLVFPNPSRGPLYIEGRTQELINLYNGQGQWLETIPQPGPSIDLSHHLPGMYLLEIRRSDQSKRWIRILLQ